MTRKKANPPVRAQSRNRAPFYAIIAVVAVAGLAALYFSANQARQDTLEVDAATMARLADGAPSGYVIGDTSAPVHVIEFADFECNACMQFATITEPDVRRRLVESGQISFEYFFFPLEQHPNSANAAHAAACAADQGRFWEMHDAIFQGYNDWALRQGRSPKGDFERYARNIGLDVGAWERCYDDGEHRDRILAHKAYGMQLGVNSTPTFVIGDQMVSSAISYDRFKAHVDSAAAKFAATSPMVDSLAGR